MKVAILMPMGTQRGGGELMLWQLLKYSADHDIEWLVIFFEEGPLIAEFEQLGIETHLVPTGRLRHLHRYIWAVSRITSVARAEQVDLIFSWSGKPHLYGSVAAALARVPSSWFQLGCPSGRHLTWMDRLATLMPAQYVFTLSAYARDAQKDLWPRRRTHLVYPSADLGTFDPDRLPSQTEARKKLGLPLNRPIMGIVGRLQRWKGIHIFMRALHRVREKHPAVHGLIVGGEHALEPDYPAHLNTLIRNLNLQDHLTLAGFQNNVPEWMQAMDVVVHASDHEPFGIVIVEAMALGKPVVAGAEGGPSEIITNEENGLLASYGDVQMLARQVIRYLENPEFTSTIAANARQRALDFSPARYAQRMTSSIRLLHTPGSTQGETHTAAA